VVLRFEHRRGEVPEGAHLRVRRAGAERGAGVADLRRRGQRLRSAHQREQVPFEVGPHRGVGGARRDGGIVGDVAPAPVDRPEVGRMDALGLDAFLHRAVRGEERERRDALAGEQPAQVVEQRERRLLEIGDELGRERLRLGDRALHRSLARAQHDRRRGQADQLERADALVDLRARGAQHAGVDRVDVGAGDRLGILQEAAQRLVRGLERTPQLFVDPRDRAEVIARPRPRQVVDSHQLAVHRASRRVSSWGVGSAAAFSRS